MTEKEIKQMQADNEALRHEVDQLKNEIIRLVERNLDLSQRLEEDVELRRRAEVAREILSKNIRTLQRRMQEVVGMTPVEYRMLFNRDV
ncbi:MAG: hypothetical protein K6E15_06480 [Prevotella sp.]|nr:hypothetical protein [Prevotella sp.]